MRGGVIQICGIAAAVFALTTFAPDNFVSAEPAPPAAFTPVPTPAVAYSNLFALPYAAPTYDFGKLDPSKFRKDVPDISLDTVDLGKSILRVEVVDNVVTRPGDPNLTDVIVPARSGKKRSTPRYFGFTLTTATN
jgi:hypothetical protein